MSNLSRRILVASACAFALVTALVLLRPQTERLPTTSTAAFPAYPAGILSSPVRAHSKAAPRPAPEKRLLATSMHGRAALRALGSNLATAAAVNGRNTADLRSLLLSDSTMWLDRDGQLFVRDVWPTPRGAGAAARAVASSSAIAVAPLNQTFSLHSDPGSQHTIYLDFVGATLGNDYWTSSNQSTPAAPGTYAPWSLDGDPGFSTTEETDIQEIWARVAEDYAQFDVDVTTEAPSSDALVRTSLTDQTYGVRVLFSGGPLADSVGYQSGSAAHTAVCGGSCGGVAPVGTITRVSSASQPDEYFGPAWIFTDNLGPNLPKYMADAAAHEVGHTFGLTHQGLTTDTCAGTYCSYYRGIPLWGPLMGAPYNSAVTQWAKGEYPNANNQQDEISVIGQSAPPRLPSAGTSIASAVALSGSASGFITGADDHEYYALGSCSGSVAVTGTPAAIGPGLDVNLSLLDLNGNVIGSNDPPDVATAGQPATVAGLSASLNASPANPTTYYLMVSGGGSGANGADDPTGGFTNYASAGAYTVTATGCTPPSTTPSQPLEVQLNPGCNGQILNWSAPADAGSTDAVSYEVSLDNSNTWTSVGTNLSAYFPGISGGHTYNVRAVNSVGHSAASSLGIPGAVNGLTVTYSSTSGTTDWYNLSWNSPANLGGLPIQGYYVSSPWNATFTGNGVSLGIGAGSTVTTTLTPSNAAGSGTPIKITLKNTGPTTVLQAAPTTNAYAGTPASSCPSSSPSPTPTTSTSPSPSPTPSSSPTPTTSPSPSVSPTPSSTPTPTPTPSPSPTITPTPTTSPSPTATTPPNIAPSAPRSVRLVRGAAGGPLTCIASWAAPVTARPGVNSYQVRIQTRNSRGRVVATRIVTVSRSPLQFSGARGNTYRIQVRAQNSVGWGGWSGWTAWVAPR